MSYESDRKLGEAASAYMEACMKLREADANARRAAKALRDELRGFPVGPGFDAVGFASHLRDH